VAVEQRIRYECCSRRGLWAGPSRRRRILRCMGPTDGKLDATSRRLLVEVEQLRPLELKKRRTARNSQEFHELAAEVHNDARDELHQAIGPTGLPIEPPARRVDARWVRQAPRTRIAEALGRQPRGTWLVPTVQRGRRWPTGLRLRRGPNLRPGPFVAPLPRSCLLTALRGWPPRVPPSPHRPSPTPRSPPRQRPLPQLLPPFCRALRCRRHVRPCASRAGLPPSSRLRACLCLEWPQGTAHSRKRLRRDSCRTAASAAWTRNASRLAPTVKVLRIPDSSRLRGLLYIPAAAKARKPSRPSSFRAGQQGGAPASRVPSA